MLALLFFVVCAVIGSIFLTAASTAAGRARVISNEDLEGYSFDAAVKMIEKNGSISSVSFTQTQGDEEPVSTASLSAQNFSDVISYMAKNCYLHNSTTEWASINSITSSVNTETTKHVERVLSGHEGNGTGTSHASDTAIAKGSFEITRGSIKGIACPPMMLQIEMYQNYDVKITATNKNVPDEKHVIWLYASEVKDILDYDIESRKWTRSETIGWGRTEIDPE